MNRPPVTTVIFHSNALQKTLLSLLGRLLKWSCTFVTIIRPFHSLNQPLISVLPMAADCGRAQQEKKVGHFSPSLVSSMLPNGAILGDWCVVQWEGWRCQECDDVVLSSADFELFMALVLFACSMSFDPNVCFDITMSLTRPPPAAMGLVVSQWWPRHLHAKGTGRTWSWNSEADKQLLLH